MISVKKAGGHTGIYSICSSNKFVIAAAMSVAKRNCHPVLIESTCNQVNQFGGYSNMRPVDFRNMVRSIAETEWFSNEMVILGGDHLGPNPWKTESSESAMEKSYDLVREYVKAGYKKIHIDASMLLGDDLPNGRGAPDPRMIAFRTAHICKTAEKEFLEYRLENPGESPPIYVIGTEVPVPGGINSENIELSPAITKVSDFKETVELCREYFRKFELEEAWERVVAVVVQPGVEFSNEDVFEYVRDERNAALKEEMRYHNLVFETHSTDYQHRKSLRELVEDGSGFLKVGPALTFAFREAVMALHLIEKDLCDLRRIGEDSRISEVLEKTMMDNDMYWKDYYSGNEYEKRYFLKYGLSDRCRYYWNFSQVKNSLDVLLRNFNDCDIPLPLISQYMPIQYQRIRNGKLNPSCDELIRDYICRIMEDYEYAISKDEFECEI